MNYSEGLFFEKKTKFGLMISFQSIVMGRLFKLGPDCVNWFGKEKIKTQEKARL